MSNRLFNYIITKLVKAEIIPEIDADVYQFGLFQSLMMFLNLTTTIILGVLYKQIFLCILLNLSYIPLRINAGGHHADSPFRCYINSTIMIAFLLSVIKWIKLSAWISVLLMFISCSIIIMLAPIETENNPLDEIEKKVFRKRTMFILLIEIGLYTAFMLLQTEKIALTINLGITAVGAMLLFGHTTNKKIRRYL